MFKSTEVQIPLNCNWANVLSYTSVVVEAVELLGMSQHIWFDTPTRAVGNCLPRVLLKLFILWLFIVLFTILNSVLCHHFGLSFPLYCASCARSFPC